LAVRIFSPHRLWSPTRFFCRLQLRLMKNFAKAMEKSDETFKYLFIKFTRMSEAKIKKEAFGGLQIRKLLREDEFLCLLRGNEKVAWLAFQSVVNNLLKNRTDNYQEIVENILLKYKSLG
jgi:hypothetical protein